MSRNSRDGPHSDPDAAPQEIEAEVLSIKFGIQALRPIQIPAGGVVGLAGNLVHWQSRCRRDHPTPAASLTALFRSPEAGPCAFEGDAIGKEALFAGVSVADRLAHVAKALMLEACEGGIGMAAFPEVFRERLA